LLKGRNRLVPFALIAVLAAACGVRGEPTGSLGQGGSITARDATGAIVTLPGPAQHVVVTDAAAAATIAAIAPDVKVDRVAPKDLAAAAAGDPPPDLLVLGPLDPAPPPGIPTFRWPPGATTSPGLAIVQLGLLLGHGAEAVTLAHAIDAGERDVLARVAGAPPVRVMVEQGTFEALGPESGLGRLVARLGGTNIVAAPAILTPSRIRSLDPEVWLGTAPGSSSLSQLRTLRDLKNVSAVRRGRVARIDPTRLEPSPTFAAELLALARLLHPTA
jgi:ABC-type Fe3+-hydroxamate transport system substrate-binding protein